MALENCPVCGKVFGKTTRALCAPCWDREQSLYDRVSEYVFAHPEAEADEVLESTGVTLEDLEYLLKRGRLLGFERLVATVLRCQRCSDPIMRGQYCQRCVKALREEGKPLVADPAPAPQTPEPSSGKPASQSREGVSTGHRGEFWRSRSKR